jgi:hypothetical protein
MCVRLLCARVCACVDRRARVINVHVLLCTHSFVQGESEHTENSSGVFVCACVRAHELLAHCILCVHCPQLESTVLILGQQAADAAARGTFVYSIHCTTHYARSDCRRVSARHGDEVVGRGQQICGELLFLDDVSLFGVKVALFVGTFSCFLFELCMFKIGTFPPSDRRARTVSRGEEGRRGARERACRCGGKAAGGSCVRACVLNVNVVLRRRR